MDSANKPSSKTDKLKSHIDDIRQSLDLFEQNPNELGLRNVLDNFIRLADCTTHLEATKKESSSYRREANKLIEDSKKAFQKGQTGLACGCLNGAIFSLFFAIRSTIKKEESENK